MKKKIFITGSTTGLGLLAGKILLKEGHEVILHARTEKSRDEARASLKEDVPFVIGDLSIIEETKSVAQQANALGPYDAIIQNAGVYERGAEIFTKDGLRTVFAVNVLAPYILSTLIQRPERMVFLSSGMHLSGDADLSDLQWKTRTWNSTQAYSDSKLFNLMLAKWFARNCKDSYINAVDPGWVPTRMGGPGAPDDLIKGAETQAWLSESNEPEALVSGQCFHHKKVLKHNPLADSHEAQDKLISLLKKLGGL